MNKIQLNDVCCMLIIVPPPPPLATSPTPSQALDSLNFQLVKFTSPQHPPTLSFDFKSLKQWLHNIRK